MEMIRVRSSAISAIGYDPSSQRMKITFKQGSTYDYCHVPQNVFDSFLSASSKGGYYDGYYRVRYDC